MRVLLIGCGRLGRIILEQWVSHPAIKQIWVVQPSLAAAEVFQHYSHVHFAKNAAQLPEDFLPEVTVVAIKPQEIPTVLSEYRIYQAHTIFISVAAGIPIAVLKQHLSEEAVVVRVMPNIAIKVHAGLNLAFIPSQSPENTEALVAQVFSGSGDLVPLEQEHLLDQLTAISGSGPAYFYLMMEALIQAAIQQCGVDEKTALAIVKQTFIGSALLMREDKNSDPKHLRLQVMSKGGVTEAAIDVLQNPLTSLIEKAIEKAIQRIDTLAS